MAISCSPQCPSPFSIFHFPVCSLQFFGPSCTLAASFHSSNPNPRTVCDFNLFLHFLPELRHIGHLRPTTCAMCIYVSMYLHLAGCQTLEGLHLLPASLSLCVFTFLPPAGWLLCGQLDVILIGSPASGSHGGFSFDLCCGECAINLSEWQTIRRHSSPPSFRWQLFVWNAFLTSTWRANLRFYSLEKIIWTQYVGSTFSTNGLK